MRLLQLLVALLLPIGVACRGVTVLFRPFDLGFEFLRLANVSLWPQGAPRGRFGRDIIC